MTDNVPDLPHGAYRSSSATRRALKHAQDAAANTTLPLDIRRAWTTQAAEIQEYLGLEQSETLFDL